MINYFGFLGKEQSRHSSSKTSGVALSEFTFNILSKSIQTNLFVVTDKNHLKSKKNFFFIRNSKPKLILDTLTFIVKNYQTLKTKENIIYHSFLFFPATIFFKLLNIKYILQVNEIFHLSGTHNFFIYSKIEKMMFRYSQSFIVSSESVNDHIAKIINIKTKLITIISGPISKNNLLDLNNPKNFKFFSNYKINIVYAGVVDQIKCGGAFIALDLAKKLNNSRYEIHIYGYGNKDMLDLLNYTIEHSNKISNTKVLYKGNLNQKDLIERLSFYQIALATQYIGTSFSSSSFPSKILTYLSSGNFVISANSIAIQKWKYKDRISRYEKENLEDLVEIIKKYKSHDPRTNRSLIDDIYNEIINDLINYF